MSIPAALARAMPRAKLCFTPAFQECLWQEGSVLDEGGTGPSGRSPRGPRGEGTIQPGRFDRSEMSKRAGCGCGRSWSTEILHGTAVSDPG